MFRLNVFVSAFVCSLVAAASASAQSLTSDEPSYIAGNTATLFGSGFSPGETVSLVVAHTDGTLATGAGHVPWTVVANGSGAFATEWHVCESDCVGREVMATATGATSSGTAGTLFFAANCGNGVVTSVVPVGAACSEFNQAVG